MKAEYNRIKNHLLVLKGHLLHHSYESKSKSHKKYKKPF